MEKEYEQLCFTDNFMFCKVIGSDPELCRHLLELVLGKKIRRVDIKATEKTIDVTPGAKSIRMDVYLDDDAGTVYDLEMQTTEKKNLPRRLRYYQGMMDLNLIEKGQDYDELPETVILFVCTFDYFKKGLPFYVFQNRCELMPELLLEDGTRKVFVNPWGSREGLTAETTGFLDYIRDGKPADDFTQRLELAVEKARTHREWEVEYMQWRAIEMDMNIEKKEAVAEAVAETKAEGIAAYINNCREFKLTKEDTVTRIEREFHVSAGQAVEYVEKNWKGR